MLTHTWEEMILDIRQLHAMFMNTYLHVQFLNTITLKKTMAIECVCSNIIMEMITTNLIHQDTNFMGTTLRAASVFVL